MYFTYNQSKYCTNLDWLQYSVNLREAEPELLCPDGYRVEICQGNNIFEHRALVFDGRGAKFMTLLWKPYSKVLSPTLMTVQLANEYLYLSTGAGIKWSYEVLQEIVEYTFNAIGRFDVCIDFEGSERRMAFLNHLNSGHYYAQGKHEGAVWWHDTNSGTAHRKQLHCLNWGSPKSEIKVKIYNKSREQGLIDNPNGQPDKPWIVQEWKLNEMDVTKVWRLEFSLAGAGQLRYKGEPISLENLQDEQWLMNVLFDMYHHRFVTRINQGRRYGHKNDDTRVYLMNLPSRPNILKWASPSERDYELPPAITLLRSMMRQIDNPAIMSARPTFSDYATTILNIIDNYKLHGYFLRTYERDPNDYFQELWENVGQGIRHTTPSPRILMD